MASLDDALAIIAIDSAVGSGRVGSSFPATMKANAAADHQKKTLLFGRMEMDPVEMADLPKDIQEKFVQWYDIYTRCECHLTMN